NLSAINQGDYGLTSRDWIVNVSPTSLFDKPSADAVKVRFSFLGDSGTVPIYGSSTFTFGGTNLPGRNDWSMLIDSPEAPAAVVFSQTASSQALHNDQSDVFSARIRLDGTLAARSINVQVFAAGDTTPSWSATGSAEVPHAPEPASMLLFLPGLA